MFTNEGVYKSFLAICKYVTKEKYRNRYFDDSVINPLRDSGTYMSHNKEF